MHLSNLASLLYSHLTNLVDVLILLCIHARLLLALVTREDFDFFLVTSNESLLAQPIYTHHSSRNFLRNRGIKLEIKPNNFAIKAQLPVPFMFE